MKRKLIQLDIIVSGNCNRQSNILELKITSLCDFDNFGSFLKLVNKEKSLRNCEESAKRYENEQNERRGYMEKKKIKIL